MFAYSEGFRSQLGNILKGIIQKVYLMSDEFKIGDKVRVSIEPELIMLVVEEIDGIVTCCYFNHKEGKFNYVDFSYQCLTKID